MNAAGLVLLGWLAAAAAVHLRSLKHPRRGYLRRMRDLQRHVVGDSATDFVRSLVPLALLALWAGVGGGLGLIATQWPSDATAWAAASRVVVVAFPIGLLAAGVLFLVVRYAGRPRWAIPKAFRQMDETELRDWFSAD